LRRLLDLLRSPSLFRRLYVYSIGALFALTLLQAFYLYTRLIRVDGRNVVEELSQTANAYVQLLSTPGLTPQALEYQAQRLAEITISMTPASMSAEDLKYSVWSGEGRLLAHSRHAAVLPIPHELNRVLKSVVAGQTWLCYGAQSADGRLSVAIAQPQSFFWRAARSMSVDAGRTLLIAALALAALVGLGTRAGLAPLRRAAETVRQRDANDLSALELPTQYQELAPLVDAINALLARVARMLQTERAFLADAAHELRTPLAALSTQAWVLAHASTDDERLRALVPLEQGVVRAADVLGKLLTLSRLDATEPSTHQGSADLADMVRERLTQLAGRANGRRIELSYDGLRHAATTLDAHSAISVLDNVLENALRHAPEGGRIEVRIESVDEMDATPRIRLIVADNGAGVPTHERERIFARFYRMPGTSGEGSGLGLAIVRRILELHRGQICVEETPGGGATFVLELPALSNR
jgi:signal transduction histidine kinase